MYHHFFSNSVLHVYVCCIINEYRISSAIITVDCVTCDNETADVVHVYTPIREQQTTTGSLHSQCTTV